MHIDQTQFKKQLQTPSRDLILFLERDRDLPFSSPEPLT